MVKEYYIAVVNEDGTERICLAYSPIRRLALKLLKVYQEEYNKHKLRLITKDKK